MPPAFPDHAFDRAVAARFGGLVCGVDEVGRGPWAGPVVTAAVACEPGLLPAGVADSKMLAAPVRERLFAEIIAVAAVSVTTASVATIDAMNIRAATLGAMRRAVAGLCVAPTAVLVDGRDIPEGLPCPAEAVVQGDALSPLIAAASIVAKVIRDRLMCDLALAVPGYGFERHKGYGTPEHAAALARLGPSVHHRRSFAPVRAALEGLAAAGRARGSLTPAA